MLKYKNQYIVKYCILVYNNFNKGVERLMDTKKLLDELKNCENFKIFYNEHINLIERKQLSDYLAELIKKKGIKKSDAVKASELNEIYAYQIFSGVRIPERKKLLSITLGMKLSLEETQELLKVAGYAPLYLKNEFDCVVIYGICKNLSIIDINSILYENNLETLG